MTQLLVLLWGWGAARAFQNFVPRLSGRTRLGTAETNPNSVLQLLLYFLFLKNKMTLTIQMKVTQSYVKWCSGVRPGTTLESENHFAC